VAANLSAKKLAFRLNVPQTGTEGYSQPSQNKLDSLDDGISEGVAITKS